MRKFSVDPSHIFLIQQAVEKITLAQAAQEVEQLLSCPSIREIDEVMSSLGRAEN